jgi:ribose transport system substrate-binding protein
MAQDHDDHDAGISRRHALQGIVWGGGVLWAVSGGLPHARAAAQDRPRIAVIVKDTTYPYWQTVLAGARKAGQDLGVDVIALGAQSEADVDGQIAHLRNAVAAKPAAVVIAPTQFAALGKPIDEAARTVKIIGIDSAADTAAFASLLATDHAQAGRLAADALAAAIQRSYADAEGDVALIMPARGIAALDERAKGFAEQLAAKYGALAIVARPVGDGRPASGARIMADLIAAYPELRGVFAANRAMTRGAVDTLATRANNTTGDKINLVGFDADEGLVKSLQDGTLAAVIMQDPFRMGYDGVKTALAASRGEQVPAKVDTGASLITKATMSSPRSQELLNPQTR